MLTIPLRLARARGRRAAARWPGPRPPRWPARWPRRGCSRRAGARRRRRRRVGGQNRSRQQTRGRGRHRSTGAVHRARDGRAGGVPVRHAEGGAGHQPGGRRDGQRVLPGQLHQHLGRAVRDVRVPRPVVRHLGRAAPGVQIGAAAQETRPSGGLAVRVPAGGVAHAWLQVAPAGNYPASTCHPVTAHWLRVFPPGDTVASYVDVSFAACASASTPLLTVMPVRSGQGVRGVTP